MDELINLIKNKYSLDITNDIKLLNINLPFIKENEKLCKNLKYNGGLYTQCSKECETTKYCRVCQSEINKLGSNKYGSTSDRKEGELFVSKDGKTEIAYTKYMKMHGYTKEMVLDAAKIRNIIIPESIFIEKNDNKLKENNKKREEIKSEEEKEKKEIKTEKKKEKKTEENKQKKGRGRPKKSETLKEVLEDDLELEEEELLLFSDNEIAMSRINSNISDLTLDSRTASRIDSICESRVHSRAESEYSGVFSKSDDDDLDEVNVIKIIVNKVEYLKDINSNNIYNKEGEFIGIYKNENTIIFD